MSYWTILIVCFMGLLPNLVQYCKKDRIELLNFIKNIHELYTG